MNYKLLKKTIYTFSKGADLEIEEFKLDKIFESLNYNLDDSVNSFTRALVLAGSQFEIAFEELNVEIGTLDSLVESDVPIILFKQEEVNNQVGAIPLVVQRTGRHSYTVQEIAEDGVIKTELNKIQELKKMLYVQGNGIPCVVGMSAAPSLSYNHKEKEDPSLRPLTSMGRFLKLLKAEKKEIIYLYMYTIVGALINLSIPLGIQAIIGFVSGGTLFDSLVLLIIVVTVGVAINGYFQIMQLTIVEYLQRRIFAKAAIEFAFRITRIKKEAFIGKNPPELVNRFFDILNIQKGLPKILIDFVTALLQIFLGLVLLSIYHEFFIFFSIILFLLIFIVFNNTSKRGIDTSLLESKYKYQTVEWLEEVARAVDTFKLSGNRTNLPIEKTDYLTGNYLYARKSHFKVLMGHYVQLVILKTIIAGSLLIIGSALVVNKQMNIGQLVAAEIIVILVMNSVEKIIAYIDVIYDTVTAAEKVGQVTDLPLEKSQGIDIQDISDGKGFEIEAKDLFFTYPGSDKPVLKGCSLHIAKGEKICISGNSGSGKTTLSDIIEGLYYDSYQGMLTYNGYSAREMNVDSIRASVNSNSIYEDIFIGTIKENITLGNTSLKNKDVLRVIKLLGLEDFVYKLPEGLNTQLQSSGVGLPKEVKRKIILARTIVEPSELVVIHDRFIDTLLKVKIDTYKLLMSKEVSNTFIAVSNDPNVAALCDNVAIMRDGKIILKAPYQEIKDQYAELIS